MKRGKLLQRRNRLQLVIEALLQICFFLSETAFLLLYVTTRKSISLSVTACVIVAVIVTLFFVMRQQNVTFVPFLLLHIVCTVGPIFIGHTWDERLILAICFLTICFFSMSKKVKTYLYSEADHDPLQKECLPWQTLICMIVFYSLCKDGLEVLHIFEYVMFALFVLLYLSHYYIDNLNQVLIKHRNDQVVPMKQMISVNNFIVGSIVVAGILVTGAFLHSSYGSLTTIIWKGFLYFIAFILALLELHNSDQMLVTETRKATLSETLSDEMETVTTEVQTVASENELLNRTLSIIIFIVIVVTVIVILCLIVYGIIHFWKGFCGAKQNAFDEYEAYYGDNSNKDPNAYERNEAFESSNTDYNKEMRKIYKNSVLSSLKKRGKHKVTPKDSEMPEQLSKHIIEAEQNCTDEITSLYEKARYSNQKLTDHDVKKLKEVIREGKRK